MLRAASLWVVGVMAKPVCVLTTHALPSFHAIYRWQRGHYSLGSRASSEYRGQEGSKAKVPTCFLAAC